MYRLSLIISEIYNQFLPLADQSGIKLNLDLIDPDIVTDEIAQIKTDVESAISESLQRSTQGEISIQVNKEEITISDTGTTLSKTACSLLSNKYVQVSSRVGFGTKVRIKLSRPDQESL